MIENIYGSNRYQKSLSELSCPVKIDETNREKVSNFEVYPEVNVGYHQKSRSVETDQDPGKYPKRPFAQMSKFLKICPDRIWQFFPDWNRPSQKKSRFVRTIEQPF